MPGPLSTIGTGILQTHVTLEDVQEAIQKSLNTTATFGPKLEIKNIGEGIGYYSRICLMKPDWQNPTPNLPPYFVVKIISQLAMIEADGYSAVTDFLELKSPGFLLTEIASYELFTKYAPGQLPLGKLLGYKKLDEDNNSKGFFIMDYIEDLTPIHLFDDLNLENTDEVIRAIAKMQAIGCKFTEKERAPFPLQTFSVTFGLDVCLATCNQTIEGLKEVDHPQVKSLLGDLETSIKRRITQEELEYFDNICENLNIKRVFGHCDLWSPNVLWTKKSNGELSLKAIVDFQLASFCNPVIDIIVFLICNLTAETRRQNWKNILKNFSEYLKQETGGEEPFTQKQLEYCYLRCFPLLVFMVFAMVGPIYLSELKAHPDDTEKVNNVFEKKLISTLLDAIEIDKQIENGQIKL